MSCNIDGAACDGSSLVCRLNPGAGEQTDYDYANPGVRMPFPNRECSHFRKAEDSV